MDLNAGRRRKALPMFSQKALMMYGVMLVIASGTVLAFRKVPALASI